MNGGARAPLYGCDISNDYCQGTDLDFSGTVDEADLEIFVENWLAGGND